MRVVYSREARTHPSCKRHLQRYVPLFHQGGQCSRRDAVWQRRATSVILVLRKPTRGVFCCRDKPAHLVHLTRHLDAYIRSLLPPILYKTNRETATRSKA